MLLSGLIFERAIRCALLLCFSVLLLAPARGQASGVGGTLPEDYFPGLKAVLEKALKQAPQVLLHEAEIAQSEARVYGADAQRLPNLGGDIRYDRNQTSISNNAGAQSRDNGLFYSAAISQPLFHWGALKTNSEISRIRVAIAEKNYAEGYRTLAVVLRQIYVGLVAKKAGLRHEIYFFGLNEANVKSAQEKRDRGEISAGDFASAQLSLDEARLALDRLKADFTTERMRFQKLAGAGEITEEAIPAEIPAVTYSASLATTLLADLLRAGGKNLTAEMMEMRVHEADLNYQIARVRLLPKFNAQVGYSLLNVTNATANAVNQTGIAQQTVEVNARWTVFDGFATKGAKLEALADKRYWQRQLHLATESTIEEAQRLERALELDARAIGFAEIRRAGAEEGVRRQQEEVKLGNVSQGIVDAALRELRRTEYNNALARAQFISDWSAFVSLAADDPVLNNLPSRYVRPNR